MMRQISSTLIVLIALTLSFSPKPGFTQVLPELPTHLKLPFAQATQQQQTRATELQHLFTQNHYSIEDVHQSKRIPTIFVANLPPDINALQVHQKTALFIRLLLTSVAKVNQSIIAVRTEVQNLSDKKQRGEKLLAKESNWLAAITADYYCKTDSLDELLQRIDIIPNSLVLAQAIDESGWGTSHFAREGNALYGQHLSKNSKGSFLTTPGGKVKVASFDNLYHSTASYIHTLNTTKTYAPLREEREKSRKTDKKLNGHAMAGTLGQYSVHGQQYVKSLRSLISQYKLDRLDGVQFRMDDSSILVVFNK